jgi:shikimate kinase
MGAGKSTVGRALAAAIGWQFLDLDLLIEDSQGGMKIPEIFARRGEEEFRRLETQAAELIRPRQNLVVASGGGAPTIPATVTALDVPGTVWVYLEAEFSVLAERVAREGGRPLFQDPEKARNLYAARDATYTKLSMIRVATGKLCVNDVVDEILKALDLL